MPTNFTADFVAPEFPAPSQNPNPFSLRACERSNGGHDFQRLATRFPSTRPREGSASGSGSPAPVHGTVVEHLLSIFAPAAFLTNGKVLVPIGALHDCEKLRVK